MSEENIIIRPETKDDYKVVENLTRESFWNVYRPGCMEHYVLHCYRDDPAFVPELDFVMELNGELIGQVIYVRSEIDCDDGRKVPIMTYPVAFSGICDTNDESFFSSDDAAAQVEYNTGDQKLYLVARRYTVTVRTQGGGTATATTADAGAGSEIVLTAMPDTGYHFENLTADQPGVQFVRDETANGRFTFTMPAADVTILAVFSTHDFTAENAEEMYLKSAATCTEKAVYYKSCTVCGVSSEGTADAATFASGDLLDHGWSEPDYTWTVVPDGYMCAAYSKCKNCNTDVSDVASVT